MHPWREEVPVGVWWTRAGTYRAESRRCTCDLMSQLGVMANILIPEMTSQRVT